MKLEIKSRRADYFLEFYGKYAVVTGNSGIGKTTFYRILQSYNCKGSTSVTCDKPIKVLDVNADESILTRVNNHLIVMDENCDLLHYPHIGKLLKESNNYFILICRKCMDWLPISVDNVFKVISNGKYHKFVPIVPKFNMLPQETARKSVWRTGTLSLGDEIVGDVGWTLSVYVKLSVWIAIELFTSLGRNSVKATSLFICIKK